MISVGLYPETFSFQLFIFLYLFFVKSSNFLKSGLVFLKSRLVLHYFLTPSVFFELLTKFHSLITNERYGFISKSCFHASGGRLTKICICIDPTFNMRGGIILFVGFLRHFKDVIFILCFLIIPYFSWFLFDSGFSSLPV